MSFLKSILFLIGYCVFLGPPRAFEIQVSHRATQGELSGLPFWLILSVETLFRAIFLILCATVVENAIGSFWYAWLRIDFSLAILLCAGSVHALAYFYLFIERGRRRKRFVGLVYRLVRNLCYALTPGLVAATLMLLLDGQKPTPQLSQEGLMVVYGSVSALFLVLGIAEALIVKRRPSAIGDVV